MEVVTPASASSRHWRSIPRTSVSPALAQPSESRITRESVSAFVSGASVSAPRSQPPCRFVEPPLRTARSAA